MSGERRQAKPASARRPHTNPTTEAASWWPPSLTRSWLCTTIASAIWCASRPEVPEYSRRADIHPDLANRLAIEAAAAADDVLRICIRAMDYLPPVDLTFGEFLRAMITADYDLAPGVRARTASPLSMRSAAWGIYPPDVTTLSEDSLRWLPPDPDSKLLTKLRNARKEHDRIATRLTAALDAWQPGTARGDVFQNMLRAQREFHNVLAGLHTGASRRPDLIPGLDLRPGARFAVGNLRPARRIGPHGEFRTEIVVEVVQTGRSHLTASDGVPLRGGATLVMDLCNWDVRYIIYKTLYRTLPENADPKDGGEPGVLSNRLVRRIGVTTPGWQGEAANPARQLHATYSSPARLRKAARNEPFAVLHRGG